MRSIIVLAALGIAYAAGDDFSGIWQLNYERSTLEGAAPSAPMKLVATFQLDPTATLSVNIFGFGNGGLALKKLGSLDLPPTQLF